jgi:hypothetical protein
MQNGQVGNLKALPGADEHIVRHYCVLRPNGDCVGLRGNIGPSPILQAESKTGISRLCNDQLFLQTKERVVGGKGG